MSQLCRGEERPQVVIQDGLLAHAAQSKVLEKPGISNKDTVITVKMVQNLLAQLDGKIELQVSSEPIINVIILECHVSASYVISFYLYGEGA